MQSAVLAAFNLDGPATLMPGGEGRTYRVGQVVLRHERAGAAEEAAWLSGLFARMRPHGFRVPRPVPARNGAWVAPGNWTAWTFIEGAAASAVNAADVVAAIDAFHVALRAEPCPMHLARRDSLFDRADRWAWGDVPGEIDARFVELIEPLLARRTPVPGLRDQLIHGDLNPENILVAAGQPPGIIDMAPYWRPAAFAAAIAAYWLGPYRGDEAVLNHFAHLPRFDQLLVRAGLRMLFSAMLFDPTRDREPYRTATQIICRRLTD